jgi:hypothetical protein
MTTWCREGMSRSSAYTVGRHVTSFSTRATKRAEIERRRTAFDEREEGRERHASGSDGSGTTAYAADDGCARRSCVDRRGSRGRSASLERVSRAFPRAVGAFCARRAHSQRRLARVCAGRAGRGAHAPQRSFDACSWSRDRLSGANVAESSGEEPVLRCLLSEASQRASAQDLASQDATSVRALESVTIRLRTALNAADQELLVWVEHRVSYRDIAKWLNANYGATAKRIWRLQRRLRDLAAKCRDAATREEQREIDRFLKRVATHTRSKNSLNEGGLHHVDDRGIDGAVDPERS